MTLLQTLGGTQSAGFGINQSGEFAGYTTNAAEAFHATTWATNTSAPQDLGTLPGGTNSYARGINNLGQVVGHYYDGALHGFLRDADGTLTFPIDYPGATDTILAGINDKGWMTGYYDDTKGIFHALFLQSPTEFVVFDVIPSRATYFGGINNRDFICGTYSSGPLLAHGFIARVRRSSGD